MNASAGCRRGPLFAAALALLAVALPAAAGLIGDPAGMSAAFPRRAQEARDGEILVKFKASVPAALRDARHAREGHLKLRDFRRLGVHQVRIAPTQTVAQALARYRADKALVEYAEPNYIVRAMRVPNEPAFNLLWALDNAGQTLGTPGADIRAVQAWDLVTGSPNVAVMVIDSGIDYNHPDLAPNVWVNAGEIAGNGVDDDGNGYVDDVRGIDVVNRDGDPLDDYGHGTHAAGTIGAAGNNGAGVAGVNWAVKVIGCKFLDATGSGAVADAVACLEYARVLKSRGVNIVATNNSYGALGAFSQTMRDAIDAQRDILFIAAAGNFGTDNDAQDFYPANFDLPNVISVAATDHNDQLPAFSDFGRRTVHLGAPGVNITSTTLLGTYGSANGTSMAAPHVAGVAALLKAQDGTRDWRQIRNLMLAGTDPKASLAGKSITGGRLNAFNAASCSNRPLFSVLRLPAAFTVGTPATVSALSIDCDNPVGPVTATTSSGQSVTLADDGVAPDLAAGDGIFTGTFTPAQAFASISFSSPTGSETIGTLDLAIRLVSGPSAANRGDVIPVGVTVANPSTVATPASSVNLYLSTDGTITTADTGLASLDVPPLAPGEQRTLTASAPIPANLATGTYFLGAIVDAANQLAEGDETNNARAGNTIAIGNLSIDLTVSTVSAPATAFTGDPIAVSATVTNAGSGAAGPSTLNFYLSADNAITASDRLIGTAAIGALAGGASQAATGTVPIPVDLAPGTYFIGAIADAGNAVIESNEANNALAGPQITTTTRSVDFSVYAVVVPNTIKGGQPFRVDASLKNLGTAASPPTTLRWYLSTDNVITTADTLLSSVSVPALKGGGSIKFTASNVLAPAGLPAGTYYIGAIVDPDNLVAETSKANNAVPGGTTNLSYNVDLVLTAASGPASGATGQSVTFTGTLRNQGTAATSGNVTVGFYLSSDANIATNDRLVASITVAPIAAGTSVPISVNATIPTSLAAGTYYVGAIADPGKLVPESNDGNNALAGNTIAIAAGPDLVMTAVAGPPTATRGQSITLTGTVKNQGVGAVGALGDQDVNATAVTATVGFYLSTDPTITTADRRVAAVTTTSIAAGQVIPLSVTLTIPADLAPGTYYVGAIADYTNAVRESDEVNNALAGGTIVIQ